MVPSERTVTVAVGHGKKAARNIDAWLRGTTYAARAEAWRRHLRQAQHLVLQRRAEERAAACSTSSAANRPSRKCWAALNESNALFEARRCLSCGNCFECDNCYGVCPDNAVIKLGPGKRFSFNYDYCKGCGICVAECPCGAITTEAEKI